MSDDQSPPLAERPKHASINPQFGSTPVSPRGVPVLERLHHFINALQTHWSTDPGARGAAKMTAGAILAAEGLFGAIRSGRNGKGGLLGGVIGIGFGAVFMILGQWMAPGYDDEVLVEGRIIDVRSGESEGGAVYSPVYSYAVDGTQHEFISSIRSSSRPTIGESVTIAYSAREPRNAYRADGIEGHFHTIFFGTGALIALLAFFSLVTSVLLLTFGVWLFLQGRKDRMSASVSRGFLADLAALTRSVRAGEVNIQATAVGVRGASQGQASANPTTL
ncbi:MAG: DUF3592 domain-containing protein [Pseudomonadales bacterium]